MPVSSGPRPSLRAAIVVGLAGVVVALGLVGAVLLLTRTGTDVEIRLGDRDFRDMEIGRISAEIEDRGPILFGDVAAGSLDIILQHIGDDPETGWFAFEARRTGQSRDCFFRWRPEGVRLRQHLRPRRRRRRGRNRLASVRRGCGGPRRPGRHQPILTSHSRGPPWLT